MNHKPMLAVDCGGIETVRFPVIASPKLDGIRAIISAEGVLSRTLKPIPNRHVQEMLKGLPVGLDGELLAGEPTAPDVYRKTNSMVMSEDKPIDGLVYHVFDYQVQGITRLRLARVRDIVRNVAKPTVVAVPQCFVDCVDALTELEDQWVKEGYEGVILRNPSAVYKHGRSTQKEGYLLKLKRFKDSEAEVIGVVELMHNANEAKTNELGRMARSHHKAGKEPMGVLGALQVRDVKSGVEFQIGTGFTAEDRAELWLKRHTTPGASTFVYGQEFFYLLNPKDWPLAKYKYFPVGVKDKPRHPVFLGWRDKLDV